MFFAFTETGFQPVEPEEIDETGLTAGYVSVEELDSLCGRLGFDKSSVRACRNAEGFFRSGVEAHRDYTFTELRILNADEGEDDRIALFLRRNLILVVDIADWDGSTKAKYLAVLEQDPAGAVCCEKLLSAFFGQLLAGDHKVMETMENLLSEKEEELLESEINREFNADLLRLKKLLSKRHTYYAQLLDVVDAVGENANGIFEEERLFYLDNTAKKIQRLYEDTGSLRSSVEHLQDAYSSYLDIKLNNTMKLFTVLTSIFFPLTIIVGWYGMNFQSMPEFTWKYGYLYVIALSIVTVWVLISIGRRKKWF